MNVNFRDKKFHDRYIFFVIIVTLPRQFTLLLCPQFLHVALGLKVKCEEKMTRLEFQSYIRGFQILLDALHRFHVLGRLLTGLL